MAVGLFADRVRRVVNSAGRRSVVAAAVRRLRAATAPDPQRQRSARLRTLADVYAVLGSARTLIERGWMQGGWLVERQRADASAPAVPEVTGACLVAAVVHASRERDPAAGLIEA